MDRCDGGDYAVRFRAEVLRPLSTGAALVHVAVFQSYLEPVA